MKSGDWPAHRAVAWLPGSLPMGGVVPDTPVHAFETTPASLALPRDGYMAFVRSPDNISVELLQKGERLAPAKPWVDMPNTGTW